MEILPKEVSDVEIAFSSNIDKLLPAHNEIPEEFNDWDNKWSKIASGWFYNGLDGDTEFIAKKGIDAKTAFRHVKVILGSYEPKHEHKMAGAAYLLSLWFKEIK